MLPTGFSAIINWLGPLLGTSFHVFLSTLFILLGDPIAFTTLFAIWAIVGLLAYFIGVLHSSPQEHVLNIGELLSYSGTIQFSPQATISVLSILVPNAARTGEISFDAKIISTVSPEQISSFIPGASSLFNQSGLPIDFQSVDIGAILNSSMFSLDFVFKFPIQLRVYKTVTPSAADQGVVLTVMVTILNNDTDIAANVFANDTFSLLFYRQSGARLVSGSLQHSWSNLSGKTTVNYSYTISLPREGVYTLMLVIVTYTWNDTSFFAISPFAYAKMAVPNVLTVSIVGVTYVWTYATEIVEYIPGFHGYGSLIVALIVIAFIVVIAFTEFWGYRKAHKKVQKIVTTQAPTV